jgi:phosphoribosylglycinamide formyltransferase-1
MQKIFFPLPGVGFSELDKHLFDLRQVFVIPVFLLQSFMEYKNCTLQSNPTASLLLSISFKKIPSPYKKTSGMPPGNSTVRVAILASGAGSNAQNLIDHFRLHPFIHVALLAGNNPAAGVWQIAEKEKMASLLFEKERFFRGDHYLSVLTHHQIDFIILAGFLWKIPSGLVRSFPRRMINIHPALLPKFGGKGMYGRHVHEAVIAASETESGISIHYVDELYDHGQILLQAKYMVKPTDTPDDLATAIHRLEHRHFPALAELIINLQNFVKT